MLKKYKKFIFYFTVISCMTVSSVMSCQCSQNVPQQAKPAAISNTESNSKIEGKIIIPAITNAQLLSGISIPPRGIEQTTSIAIPPRGITGSFDIKSIDPAKIKDFIFYINNIEVDKQKVKITGESTDKSTGDTFALYSVSGVSPGKDILVSATSPNGKIKFMAIVSELKANETVKKDIDKKSTAIAIIKSSEEGNNIPVEEIEKNSKLKDVEKAIEETLAKTDISLPVTEVEEVKAKGKTVAEEITKGMPSSSPYPYASPTLSVTNTPSPAVSEAISPTVSPLTSVTPTPGIVVMETPVPTITPSASASDQSLTYTFLFPGNSITIPEGLSVNFYILRHDADNSVSMENAAWSSSSYSVGYIDPNGKFSPKHHGTTTVTGKFNSMDYTSNITVTDSYLKSFSISQGKSITLPIGQSIQLTATGKDDKGNSFTLTPEWHVDYPYVGTINHAGFLTATVKGKSYVDAKINNHTETIEVIITD